MRSEGTFSVIYNPIATRFSEDVLDHLVSSFEKKGLTLRTLAKSEYAGHVIPLVRELDPVSDYLVTLGGDGTANEAVRAFHEAGQHGVYCHVSAGTTNDMANNFRLSRKDPKRSIDILMEKGEDREMDSLLINGEPVCYVSAFGYVAPIPFLTDVERKRRLGHAAYVLDALPILLKRPESIPIRYTANGRTEERVIHLALITSSRGMGGVTLYPDNDLNDGKMDVFLLRDFSPSIIPHVFRKYLSGSIDLRELERWADVFTTDSLTIEFTGDLPAHEVDNDGNRAGFSLKDSRVLTCTMGRKIRVLRPDLP